MRSRLVSIFAVTGVLLFGGSAVAITVDGNPTDWLGAVDPHWSDATGQLVYIDGLSKPGSTANNFAFVSSVAGGDPTNIYAAEYIEDAPGPGDYVGPGYGGQNFDVEAMYVAYLNAGENSYVAGDGLYVGIFTGFDSTGEGGGHGDYASSTWYKPGDIFFDINKDGSWDFAIEAFGNGTSIIEGHVYAPTSSNWWTLPTDYTSSKPYAINHANAVDVTAAFGSAASNLIYNDRSSDHNFIEAFLDEQLLIWGQENGYWSGFSESTDTLLLTHWTQSCGNDVANVTVSTPPAVPEPATMVVLGCLGLGMFAARKMRSKRS